MISYVKVFHMALSTVIHLSTMIQIVYGCAVDTSRGPVSINVYLDTRVVSSMQCQRLCWYSSSCRSCSWDTRTGLCQLSKDTKDTSPGSFSATSHPCRGRPCSEDEICFPVEGVNKHICQPTVYMWSTPNFEATLTPSTTRAETAGADPIATSTPETVVNNAATIATSTSAVITTPRSEPTSTPRDTLASTAETSVTASDTLDTTATGTASAGSTSVTQKAATAAATTTSPSTTTLTTATIPAISATPTTIATTTTTMTTATPPATTEATHVTEATAPLSTTTSKSVTTGSTSVTQKTATATATTTAPSATTLTTATVPAISATPTTIATTTTTMTTATPPATTEACTPSSTYTTTYKMYPQGLTHMASYSIEERADCQSRCTAYSLAVCFMYSFDTTAGKCYLYEMRVEETSLQYNIVMVTGIRGCSTGAALSWGETDD